MPSPPPAVDPDTDTKRKDLLLALQAAKATGVQQAIDALQHQLDAHCSELEAQQPIEHRLAKARALSTKLHTQRQSLEEELQEAEARLAALRKALDAKDAEWRAAQAQVAVLAQQQPPAAPAAPMANPAKPDAPSPHADSAQLAELRAMLAAQADKIPPELRELLRKHQQGAPATPQPEAPKRELDTAHDSDAAAAASKKQCTEPAMTPGA